MRLTKSRIRRFLSHYWLLMPAIFIYIVFLIYPMIDSFVVSLHEWDGLSLQRKYLGLENYIKFFKDPVSLFVFKNNLIWIAFTLVIPVGVGLLLAIILNRKMVGTTIFRSLFYSPAILPLVSVGIIWAWIYNPFFGALNAFLKLIGLPSLTHGWLAERQTALYAVIATAIWQNIGFPMILFLAGLQGIPKEIYEAAEIDGASGFQRFLSITIPSLRETFVIVISLIVVSSLKVFDLVYVMTWGGPGRTTQVLATWMYFNTFLYHNAGYGSTIAWIMTFAIMIIAFPYIRIMSRR